MARRVPEQEDNALCAAPGCGAHSRAGSEFCEQHAPEVEQAGEVGIDEPSPRRGSSRYADATDPVVRGSLLAQRLIMEEEEARLRFWKEQSERRSGQKLKNRPPSRLAAYRPRMDLTEIRDPKTGRTLVKPGYQARWVKEVDEQGNPCDHRIEEMKAYGYEVIRTSTGEPLRGIFGVAMQARIEDYAKRIAINMPVGALDRNALLADADEAIRETNRRAGERVVGWVKEPDHKRERFEYQGSPESKPPLGTE